MNNNRLLDQTYNARETDNWDLHRLSYWGILLFALVVRFKDLSTGLPLHTLYGENEMLRILRNMLEFSDWNPGRFDLPALAYYIYLPFLSLFYLIGHLAGYFPSLSAVSDSSLLFIGRFVCALFGTATVVMVYRAARRLAREAALPAMLILAVSPQHIEFSHMLRPEIPAIFFVVVAYHAAFSILRRPNAAHYRLFGFAAGCAFSIKYTIGFPLFFILFLTHWFADRNLRRFMPLLQALLLFAGIFAATNHYLLPHLLTADFWQQRAASLYSSGDYYGRNIFFYYLDFLSRYNYGWPLLLLSALGFGLTLYRQRSFGLILLLYPLILFAWLCSFYVIRVHGLLPAHPFLALATGTALGWIWNYFANHARKPIAGLAFTVLICLMLYHPVYRTGSQAYRLAQIDNRSKAELWMTNRLPAGSRIAVLQYNQVELDRSYFLVEDFYPHDYVLNNKSLAWFRERGFDYVVVSSGQYIRYFAEGDKAVQYREYFNRLFVDGEQQGRLVLDLNTHPLLIPDYRIKVYSTRGRRYPPRFLPAIDAQQPEVTYELQESGSIVSLPPGCYSVETADRESIPSSIRVTNLKLRETILRKQDPQGLLAAVPGPFYFPFSIFPVRENTDFHLFAGADTPITSNQLVEFQWTGATLLLLKRVPPVIDVNNIKLTPLPAYDPSKPYLEFDKNQTFRLKCVLQNRSPNVLTGYIEAFLSEIGEPQPWKDFATSSGMQEFYLERAQRITIDLPVHTGKLTGDHQLSYWIFTRTDLPFSPQNGGWFNKQIRVSDPRLGIHPLYGIPIP